MINIIKKHFPDSRRKWKSYTLISIPIMFGTLIYSLNGFIDNFMVGSIKGGAAALSAANMWSGVIFAILASICATAAIFVAQYYNKKDFENARKMQRVRTISSLSFAIIFAICAISLPKYMVQTSLGANTNNSPEYQDVLNRSTEYIKIIAFTWIFVAISMPASLSLSETGHGKYFFWIALSGLIMNIVGNYLFIYIFKWGVQGAAYSTLISRMTTFMAYQIAMLLLKFELFLNPLKIFKIGKDIFKQFLKRSFLMVFSSGTFILIELRMPLFSRGYPIGSIGGSAGAMSVFALTFAIMNMFMTTFSAIEANSANFIGKELGKGNLKQARINSDQLKGFNTLIATILALTLFGISFAIPSFTFLASEEPAKHIILENVKYTIWTIAFMYPFWVWLESSRINSLSGGKVNIQTTIDFIYGVLQLLFLVVIIYLVVPVTHLSLPLTFFYFSLFDFVVLIAFEITYHKLKWNQNITEEFAKAEIDVSHDHYKTQISHE